MARKVLGSVLIALAFVFYTSQAGAISVVGDQLFYTGGGLRVQNLPADSGHENYIYLRTPLDGDKFLFIDDGDEQVAFSHAELAGFGIDVGDELVFMILPDNQLPAFFTGPASRNPDNLVHALFTDLGDGWIRVGFEDLLDGGDFDFNDAQFNVPEPSSLLIFGLGIVGLRLRRRIHA